MVGDHWIGQVRREGEGKHQWATHKYMLLSPSLTFLSWVSVPSSCHWMCSDGRKVALMECAGCESMGASLIAKLQVHFLEWDGATLRGRGEETVEGTGEGRRALWWDCPATFQIGDNNQVQIDQKVNNAFGSFSFSYKSKDFKSEKYFLLDKGKELLLEEKRIILKCE